MKINVLGAEYSIFHSHHPGDSRLENMDGFCDETTKEIAVMPC